MIDIDQNNQFISGLYHILTEIPLGLILRTLIYTKEFKKKHLKVLHQCALLYISIKLPWDAEEKI